MYTLVQSKNRKESQDIKECRHDACKSLEDVIQEVAWECT